MYITGRVFRDFNEDGAITANGVITETGVQSVTVAAYGSSGSSCGSTSSDLSGYYTLTTAILSCDGPYRIEFTNLPTGYEPSRSREAIMAAQSSSSTAWRRQATSIWQLTKPVIIARQTRKLLPANGCKAHLTAPLWLPLAMALPPIGMAISMAWARQPIAPPAQMLHRWQPIARLEPPGAWLGMRPFGTLYTVADSRRKAQLGPLGNESPVLRVTLTGAFAPALYVDLNSIFGNSAAGLIPIQSQRPPG